MIERSILFAAPMVRALLAGTKTQTRRVVKPQPPQHTVAVGRWQDPPGFDAAWWAFVREGAVQDDHPFGGAEIHGDPWRCPYGQPGDHLWVRETWRVRGGREFEYQQDRAQAMYRATHHEDGFPLGWESYKWRPSIFMPRWASRITLEVTDVRVERLQDISRGDAMDEGCPFRNMAKGDDPRKWYADLWHHINGAGSWEANPWVWAINFKPVTP